MSYDFFGKGRTSLSLNGGSWEEVFDTAKRFGWKPLGTTATDIEDEMHGVGEEVRRHNLAKRSATWDGNYFICGYQEITSEDAVALAAALKRAVQFLDDHEGEEIDFKIDEEVLVPAIRFFRRGRCYIG